MQTMNEMTLLFFEDNKNNIHDILPEDLQMNMIFFLVKKNRILLIVIVFIIETLRGVSFFLWERGVSFIQIFGRSFHKS